MCVLVSCCCSAFCVRVSVRDHRAPAHAHKSRAVMYDTGALVRPQLKTSRLVVRFTVYTVTAGYSRHETNPTSQHTHTTAHRNSTTTYESCESNALRGFHINFARAQLCASTSPAAVNKAPTVPPVPELGKLYRRARTVHTHTRTRVRVRTSAS